MTDAICDCTSRRHEHGNYRMYRQHGCRCDDCRIANAEVKRVILERAKAVENPTCDCKTRTHRHGEHGMYKHGCRCDACLRAAEEFRASRQTVPSTRFTRAAWTAEEIAWLSTAEGRGMIARLRAPKRKKVAS